MGGGRGKIAARSVIGFSVAVLLAVSSAATAEEYPRRIAIAPFTILGPQEEIRQTVDVLPRLLSSRLMALAGAEVLLLPRGEKSPEESARGAGLPLLLKGSVAKLGAGYSIDVTVTEPPTGKMAGAFFASAANEDEIIFRLGDLAAEISEKLFGVKTAVRTYPTPPAVQPPGPPPALLPPTAAEAPAGVPAPVPPPSPTAAAAKEADEKWVPSSLNKVAESGRISDELHGVVSGDVDAGGNGEAVAYGKKGIYLYKVKGEEILPGPRITEGLAGHILNVEAVDLDGDGGKEIVVTGRDGESIRSSVWKKKGERYERIADRIPYFLVLLPDWQGKEVVAGQQAGSDTPFYGKFYKMTWAGKTFARGEALPADTLRAPLSSGILGLSSAKFGEEWKWIYIDENDNIRVVDPDGTAEYQTGIQYGWSGDSFEWGLYLPKTGKTRYMVRKAPRGSRGPGERLTLLVPEQGDPFINIEVFSRAKRLVLLRWDGGELIEAAGTPKGDRVYSGADFLSLSGIRRGGRVVASVIERADGVVKGGISRLVVYRVE